MRTLKAACLKLRYMNRIVLLFICILGGMLTAIAQKKAVTENGEEVLLSDDGTWKYLNDSLKTDTATIPTNPITFSKGTSSTFLLKSTKFNVGIWLDPKKWTFGKGVNNEAAEYELNLKNGDLYAMLITENMEIPLKTLKEAAIKNATDAAPDLKLVKEEYRTVNKNKVSLLEMNGTAKGIKFTYYGYYYSNARGTLQFVSYTSQNLFSKFQTDIEGLLNGLVVL